MRVMLISPPNVDVVEPFRSAKVKPPSILWGFPLGLGYLAAVLKQKGFIVSILDACFDSISIDAVINEVRKYKPDLVGVGSLTHMLRSSIELAQKIKENDRNIKIVFGGPHATYDYKSLLSFDFIDYVVLGEGEYTFLELCERLEKNEPTSEIEGIAFRCGNEVKKNNNRALIKNLDSLPLPARELVDFNKYIKSYGILERSVDVVTSRGCTHRCIFCSSSHLFGRWRTRAPENIIMELKFLVEKYPNIKSFNFMDDNFTADKQRVIKLCNLLIANSLDKYNWACLGRVDQLDEEMVNIMKSAGCVRMHLGIESGSPQILKNINKHISLEQAHNAVRLLSKAKIEAYSFFMIGHPGETRETIELTRKFAKELKSSFSGFSIAQVFPGTRLAQLQPVENWSKYIYEREIIHPSIFTHPCVPNFIPEGFTREGLKKICSNITREFIFFHSRRRIRLSIKKFITEPKLTLNFLYKIFFQ